MQFIKNRFAKITLWLIASILILFIIMAFALQTPYVQTKVVRYLTTNLSEKTGFDIHISRVSLNWFDKLTIEELKILDPDNNTMGIIESISIDYELKSLINENEISIDRTEITKVNLLVTMVYEGEVPIMNISLFSNRLKSLLKSKKGSKRVEVDEIKISNSSFSYLNQEKDSIRIGLDYHHFAIDEINSDISDFILISDTVKFSISSLVGIETKTQYPIKELNTNFFLNSNKLDLNNLNALIGNSEIKDQLSFHYNNINDFSYFNDRITIKAHLNNSLISTKDLSTLFPFKKNIYKTLYISGNFNGKIGSFSFSKFKVSFDQKNIVQGRLNMYGLPALDETFIDLNLTKSYIEVDDIIQIFQPRTEKLLSQFEHTSFTGKFLGFINDFVAAGNFITNLGHIKSDINLKLHENKPADYTGNIELINFDLNQFTNRSILDKISLIGKIEGSGLTFSSADFILNGSVQHFDLNGYDYTNITTNARFAQEYFEGKLSIDDPNLKMDVSGAINLKKDNETYQVDINLKHAQLDSIKVIDEDIFIVADLTLDAKGLRLDDLNGKADFKDVFIDYNNTPLFFDSLKVIAETFNNERRFHLNSDLLDWEFSGQFNYTKLVKELRTLYKEFELNVRNDNDAINTYYLNKLDIADSSGSQITYHLSLKNINPFFQLIPGNNHISKSFELHGIYQSGYTTMISFSTNIDTLIYKGNEFFQNIIDVSTSKISDSTNLIAALYINSQNQTFSGGINTENLLFETLWNNNHISFETNIEQKKHNNTLQLLGNVDFLKDTTVIHFDSSRISILDNIWNFDRANSVSITGEEIIFNKFDVHSKERFISMTGKLSSDKTKEANLTINDFDLSFINPIIKKQLSGDLNGYIKLRNFFSNPIIENELTIDNFKVDSFPVGNIFGKTIWKNDDRSLKVKAFVNREGFQTINVNGYYYPYQSYKPLQLRANFDQAEVSILEPFLYKYFSNINGKATGVFTISGSPSTPEIQGDGLIEEGTITVNYLNTNYQFSGNIGLDKNNILFKQLNIIDEVNNTGTLKGKISHSNFKNMVLDLHGDINNFQVLNTSSKDNELFYGTGIVTGIIDFIGPTHNLNINALATTNKGTRIFIPFGDTENIKQEDFISFTNFTDTTDINVELPQEVKVNDIKLNFDLDITQDAYCELIFDIKSGDIIRGRGDGKINMQIDTQGDFNMFGDFVIKQGGYNFTLYNIINKEFNITPDSKISWFGDPYQGILDINATYNQLTPLSPLIVNNNPEAPQTTTRSYPVNLNLLIDGPLSTPEISFDIDITDYPQTINDNSGNVIYLEDVVTDFKNRINTDEHELNRQVFSLLVLRKLSSEEFDTQGTIGNSVSEFVSNQLSYWVSQVDENLEIDVDLGSLDQEAFNTFQLRLAYTFLDGRLRVSREGGFSSNTSNGNNEDNSQTDVAGIVGDWTVEYILTEDGKFRAKMYNRTNYNSLNNSLGNSTSTSAGVSILHTQNFEQIRDLWRKERNRVEKDKNSSLKNNEDGSLL